MKNLFTCLLAALAFAGCSVPDNEGIAELYGDEVPVQVGLGLGIQTGTEVVPLSRAEGDIDYGYDTYKVALRNKYRVYVMKWIGDGLYVDQVLEKVYSPSNNNYMLYYMTEEESETGFQMFLRPGDYIIGVIVNYSSVNPNYQLVPGKKVWSRGEDPENALPLVTYSHLSSPYNHGYDDAYDIGTEIYYGFKELHVEKTPDLSVSPAPLVLDVEMRNMVGKIRFMGKSNGTVSDDMVDEYGRTYYCHYVITATDPQKPLPTGINVLGKPYYGADGQGFSYLRTIICMKARKWYQSPYNGENYIVSSYGNAQSGMFYFADPDDQVGIPATIGHVYATIYSGGPVFHWKDDMDLVGPYNSTSEMILKAKSINTVTFSQTGNSWTEEIRNGTGVSYEAQVLWKLATDGNGAVEDGKPIFGPYMETNMD